MSDLAASLATDIGVPGARGISMVGVFKFFDAVMMISRSRGIPVNIRSNHMTSLTQNRRRYAALPSLRKWNQ